MDGAPARRRLSGRHAGRRRPQRGHFAPFRRHGAAVRHRPRRRGHCRRLGATEGVSRLSGDSRQLSRCKGAALRGGRAAPYRRAGGSGGEQPSAGRGCARLQLPRGRAAGHAHGPLAGTHGRGIPGWHFAGGVSPHPHRIWRGEMGRAHCADLCGTAAAWTSRRSA